MNIIKFIEILMGKIKYLIILPLTIGILTFFLTKNLPNQFSTETSIYTGITSNSGLDVGAQRVDKLITQNEYNNVLSILKSESLFEEVGLKLLTQHLMLDKPKKDIISEKAFNELKKNVPEKVRKLIVKGNYEKSYNNLKNSITQDDKNFIYRLLNYDNPYYSINALSRLKVEQVNSSDLIKLSYETDDAGICFNTVKIAAEVFIRNYGQIKKNQKSSAVKYFQNKLDEIGNKLNTAEGELLNFNVSNDVINYYEQTKQVTTQHEEIEIRLQEVKMNFEASTAVLKKLEAEISKRFSINLKNVEVLNIRNQLVICNNDIARYEVYKEEKDQGAAKELYKKRNTLEKKLENCIDSIYNFDSNSQGIDSQKLLGEWLTAVTNYETNSALLKSMQIRQAEFMSQFKRYAPLGATIKRIEREINVYENEYLNILNNLNIALQNEQNTDMISNMRIIDEAKYQISAIPSKKKLYIIIAILFTLLFYILGVFAVELMDHRIKSPSTLKLLTGLDVLGAFCIHNNKKFINTEKVTTKAALFIFEEIRKLSVTKNKPFIIQILSIWDGAGKTYTAEIIQTELEKRGFSAKTIKIMAAISDNEAIKNSENEDIKNLLATYYKANNYTELLDENDKSNDFIISVIPSVGRGLENSILIKDADMNLIVFDSNLTWSTADQYNIEKIKQIIETNMYAILTNSMPNDLEEMYGEIPKKRSKLRILIKKTIKRFIK